MRLLDRYLAREILLPFAAGLVFLTQLIVLTQMLADVQILLGSSLAIGDVLALFGLLLPSVLGRVLPIAFLLGVVLGIGRLAEDRELVALSAVGISTARLLPVPLGLAAVLAAAGFLIAAEVEPAALAAARGRLVELVKKNVRSDVKAGTFYDQIEGYTLYAGEVRPGGRWRDVLVLDRSEPDATVLTLSRSARLEPAGTGQAMRLVLEDGEVHREVPETGDYVLATFERAEAVLGIESVMADRSGLVRGNSDRPAELFAEADRARAAGDEGTARRREASAHRKIAGALAVLSFALLAVPLGALRRGGRSAAFAVTLAGVVAHYVLLRTGEQLAQRGVLPALLALELPNLVLGALGAALLVLQVRRGVGA